MRLSVLAVHGGRMFSVPSHLSALMRNLLTILMMKASLRVWVLVVRNLSLISLCVYHGLRYTYTLEVHGRYF